MTQLTKQSFTRRCSIDHSKVFRSAKNDILPPRASIRATLKFECFLPDFDPFPARFRQSARCVTLNLLDLASRPAGTPLFWSCACLRTELLDDRNPRI